MGNASVGQEGYDSAIIQDSGTGSYRNPGRVCLDRSWIMMKPIDFVVTWVDGNDPDWFREKMKYQGIDITSGNAENRFRDWGTFRYWFRGVEKFAPWVNRVFLITCGHYPEWLNIEHPKLRLVRHADYMPAECLPTFNSNAIQMFLHRIPDLSEQFVLFDDDCFLTAATTPEDFFVNGVPCDEGLLEAINCTDPKDIFPHMMLNNSAVINKHFQKKEVLRRHFSKFINLKYGKDNIRTLLMLPLKYFSGFKDMHLPGSYRKTDMQILWDAEPESLMRTGKNKFRALDDVTIWLMKNWRICNGDFVPRSTKWGKKYELGIDGDVYQAIKTGRWKAICVNDGIPDIDFNMEKKKLCEAFEVLLPGKSSFEI